MHCVCSCVCHDGIKDYLSQRHGGHREKPVIIPLCSLCLCEQIFLCLFHVHILRYNSISSTKNCSTPYQIFHLPYFIIFDTIMYYHWGCFGKVWDFRVSAANERRRGQKTRSTRREAWPKKARSTRREARYQCLRIFAFGSEWQHWSFDTVCAG